MRPMKAPYTSYSVTPGASASRPAWTPSLATQAALRISLRSSSFLAMRSKSSASSALTNSMPGIAARKASRITQETRSTPTFPLVTPRPFSESRTQVA